MVLCVNFNLWSWVYLLMVCDEVTFYEFKGKQKAQVKEGCAHWATPSHQDLVYTCFNNVVLFLWNFLLLSSCSQPLIHDLWVLLPFTFLLPIFCTLFFLLKTSNISLDSLCAFKIWLNLLVFSSNTPFFYKQEQNRLQDRSGFVTARPNLPDIVRLGPYRHYGFVLGDHA